MFLAKKERANFYAFHGVVQLKTAGIGMKSEKLRFLHFSTFISYRSSPWENVISDIAQLTSLIKCLVIATRS